MNSMLKAAAVFVLTVGLGAFLAAQTLGQGAGKPDVGNPVVIDQSPGAAPTEGPTHSPSSEPTQAADGIDDVTPEPADLDDHDGFDDKSDDHVDNTGPDNTGPDNTGPDDSGVDNSGPDDTDDHGRGRDDG